MKAVCKKDGKAAAVEDDIETKGMDPSSTSKTTPEKSSSKKEKFEAKHAKQTAEEKLVDGNATETDGAKSEVPNNIGGEVTKKRNRLSLRKKARGDGEEK